MRANIFLAIAIFCLLKQGESYKNTGPTPRHNEVYDFIIIGGGTAGSTLASRLSEVGNWKVLLVERGDRETEMNLIPALANQLPSIQYVPSVPQKTACFGMNDNVCIHPVGNSLGGSSSVDHMIHVRGNPCDFNLWAASGATGWSYAEVLPYFLKFERANLQGLENSVYHNRSGVLSVEDVKYRTKYAHASVQASRQAGYKLIDCNSPFQLGTCYTQATTLNGIRHSAYRAFLQPIEAERPNLTILTRAHVTKIIIDPASKTAFGIEFVHNNTTYFNRVHKEVILSAGALHSPQLLMLSGIGPKRCLDELGIRLIQDLPVGENLWDHVALGGPTFTFDNSRQETFFPERFLESDLQRLFAGDPATIFSSPIGVEVLSYLRIPNKTDDAYNQICCTNRPHFHLIFAPVSLASDDGLVLARAANIKAAVYNTVFKPLADQRKEHITVLISNTYPLSKGKLWLRSVNPFDTPYFDPRYYENEKDVQVVLAALQTVFEIMKQPAFKKLGVKIHDIKTPGCEHFTFDTIEYWECAIRTLCYPYHEATGTCRMGSANDRNTVVNPRLQVHGIHKLRVIDSSVIPFPIAGHVAAATYMTAEKGADMIKESWQQNVGYEEQMYR